MTWKKRCFDFFCAVLGLVLLSPVFLVVAVLIRLENRGPIFYLQERIGYRGRPFRIFKFRTMVLNADRMGPSLTVGQDPRVTRVGTVLRKYKLDELPQLVNVLLGEMSLVGPRPEIAKYVDLYSPEQRRVLDLVPGITDPASLKYRNEAELLSASSDPERVYITNILPDKIRINLEYADRATVLRDIGVVIRTLLTVIHG
ncbi:sugar transferase [Kyrpidia sp.]|uniref:sugar transferase n=1 Tax=Kyrpidia sp. TaxID=2073077 RepID=UPI00258810A8|nr:sugar transferase [Kyrpidia sp.]MCL6576105.1 sugar transferase [Kyrpidia sp.]